MERFREMLSMLKRRYNDKRRTAEDWVEILQGYKEKVRYKQE